MSSFEAALTSPSGRESGAPETHDATEPGTTNPRFQPASRAVELRRHTPKRARTQRPGHPGQTADVAAQDDTVQMMVALTEKITADLDLDHVLQAVTDAGTAISGAAFGAFFYNDVDEAGANYQLVVLSGAEKKHFEKMPAPRITKLFEPTFSGRDTVVADDILEDPRFSRMPKGHLPLRSYLAAPVIGREGHVVGALLFGHPDVGVFGDEQVTRVHAVASCAAAAIANAQVHAAERAARQDAEYTTVAMSWLQAITATLTEAATPDEVVRVIRDATVIHGTGGLVGVHLLDGSNQWSCRTTTGVEGTAAVVGEPWTGADVDMSAVLTADLGTETGQWLTSRDDIVSTYPALAAEAPEVAAMAVLRFGSGAGTGAVCLTWSGERQFNSTSRRIQATAAHQARNALERIRLRDAYRVSTDQLRRHVEELTDASRTLQRALLPQELPRIDGIHVATRYSSAVEGAEVGGDWYDLVGSPDGRCTLVVGDVEGHNISAAAVMGRVASALRAFLSEGHQVDDALTRLNRLVVDAGVLVTCLLVSADPKTGVVQMARAGHPQPIVRSRDGVTREIDVAGGPPLGVPYGDWPMAKVYADPGDRVVLYTDGLVERRTEDIDVRTQQLVGAVAASAGTVEDVADLILAVMSPETRGDLSESPASDRLVPPADDIALVVAEFAPCQDYVPEAHATVTSPEQVQHARALTRDRLATWGLESAVDSAELLVSEMVTNALRHGGGTARLALRAGDEGLHIEVTDDVDGEAEELGALEVGIDATGGRGLFLVDVLASSWGVRPVAGGKTVWAIVAA